nr:PREDICTED: uncharacterized protein LOC109041866 isoform X1 [Bemisia tabaci]
MILALVCSHALILASSEASPTQRPSSKNFDESLDEFTAIETNRTTLIKKAVAMASDLKSNETLRFLEVVEQANEVLVNIRRYFDAGRVMFDVNEGKSNLTETEVIANYQIAFRGKFSTKSKIKTRKFSKSSYPLNQKKLVSARMFKRRFSLAWQYLYSHVEALLVRIWTHFAILLIQLVLCTFYENVWLKFSNDCITQSKKFCSSFLVS